MIPTKYLRLWQHLSKRRKRQYFLLLFLMIFASIMEVISIGSLVPFLGALTSPEDIFHHEKFKFLWPILGVTNPFELKFPFTVIFVIASLVSGATRLLLTYVSNMLSVGTGAEISSEIYRKTLYQPYAIHISRNSSEIISGIMGKSSGIIGYVLQPILTLISSTLIISSILISLILLDPYVTLGSFGIFGALYLYVAVRTKTKLWENGKIINDNLSNIYKSLQEGLGGIRDVLLDGSQKFYTDLYWKSDYPYRRAMAENTYLSAKPRYIMEAFGMAGMAVFAYTLSLTSKSLISVVPMLGSLALGAQKLLPIFQQVYSSWAIMKSGESVLIDVLQLLDQKLPEEVLSPNSNRLKFTDSIEIVNLDFKYNDDLPFVIKDFSLSIPKGSRIGFIGKTGSGKSTLLDIVMGLLVPNKGKIFVDNEELNSLNMRAWQKNLAHVPQSIFLADSSIGENIAFGVPKNEIDYDKVRIAAKRAQISDFVESLETGYESFVGERGVRLSGGQRQRIGIARALYKDASVIVFDEATSALDNETERAVMESIESLEKDLTILIIAHRLSTIEKCDKIIDLKPSE